MEYGSVNCRVRVRRREEASPNADHEAKYQGMRDRVRGLLNAVRGRLNESRWHFYSAGGGFKN